MSRNSNIDGQLSDFESTFRDAATQANAASQVFVASPAEIVLASQRDQEFLTEATELAEDAANALLGARIAAQRSKDIRLGASILASLCEVVTNVQSLGEEYCGIVPVTISDEANPTISPSVSRLLVTCARSSSRTDILDKIPWLLSWLASDGNHRNTVIRRIQAMLMDTRAWYRDNSTTVRNVLNYLTQLHLISFYLNGIYYSPICRVLRVQHVLLDTPRGPPPPNYKVLGYMLAIQLMFSGMKALTVVVRNEIRKRQALSGSGNDEASPSDDSDARTTKGEKSSHQGEAVESKAVEEMGEEEEEVLESDDDDEGFVDEKDKCVLCFGRRKNTTATPCGHLLCWTCAVEWCTTKPECPVCRQEVQLNKLLVVYNL